MRDHLRRPSFDDLYAELVCEVADTGARRTPRGKICVERRPYLFSVADAARALYGGRSRRLNYAFWAAEALAYLAGWGAWPGEFNAGRHQREHAELLIALNPNVAGYANAARSAGRIFHGAYGPRLARSTPLIVGKLRDDPDSRQAVASIWEPGLPAKLPQDTLDLPCTLTLSLFNESVADEEPVLACLAHMRSNDLNWGVPYDVAAFAAYQCGIAACLGWEVGSYYHLATSQHLYLEVKGAAECPPRVAPRAEESFLSPALRVPHLARGQLTVAQLVGEADKLLSELHDWVVVRGLDRSAFTFSLEALGCRRRDYWTQWCRYLRFRWRDHEAREEVAR